MAQDAACDERVREIQQWPQRVRWRRSPSIPPEQPALLERCALGDQPIDLLSFFATLGAPTAIHAASLRVNLRFPASEDTDPWLRAPARSER